MLLKLCKVHSGFSFEEYDTDEPSLSKSTAKFQPSDSMELDNKKEDERRMRFESMGDDDVVINDADTRTLQPTRSPTKSMHPSSVPTVTPTTSMVPSKQPSEQPTFQPSSEPPSAHTKMPTKIPTMKVKPGFPATGKYGKSPDALKLIMNYEQFILTRFVCFVHIFQQIDQ